jgi:U3 small nucleolar RNA-associated protein MPP10
MKDLDTETALDTLVQTLDNPETHILPLLCDFKEKKVNREQLINVIQHLFQHNEILAKKYQELTNKDPDDQPSGLSGLSEMIAGNGIDAETMWGQVDLQNKALNKLVKKSTKRLGKSADKICVLNMNEVLSESESEDDDNSDDGRENDEDSDGEESGSVDSATRRMQERMERTMENMDSDDEESDEEESDDEEMEEKKADAKNSEEEDSVEDPVADQMKDGFFDLNEMEDFADEEEDYLPEEAFGRAKPKKEKKKNQKSFHQRQRDGDFENDSDNDDDDLEEEYEDIQPVKRKKYRDNKEIDSLYTMYEAPKNEDDYSDEEAESDPANMNAADFFGKPKIQHYERYYKKGKNAEEVPKGPKDDDEDSWGDYDFEKEDHTGWRDETAAANEAEHQDEEDEEDKSDEPEEEEEAEQPEKKNVDNSKHSKLSEKLRRQTEILEKEMIAEKPWQMTGETTSKKRPVNSLLEGTPEFEMASKQAPTITVEQTASLEEIIKKRILAEDWDDIIPRELPDVGWHKKRGELPEVSQEKSKLGLGELYEREYLKKAVGYDVDAAEKKSEEDNAKDEMKQLFASLCSKLDALSNYHFAPRPIADEAEVRAVTAPAIAMEEVLPLHVSDARGVAPEEVYATKRGREGILRGESELEQDDRKRLRSSKKAVRRKVRKEKLADDKLISRLEPGLGLNNPYEKRKMREELSLARSRGKVTTGEQIFDTKFGSSGTFFKRLQSEAQQSIQNSSSTPDEKTEKTSKTKSSVYKL